MLEGLVLAVQPLTLMAMVVGLFLGIIFGAIPGLTATLGVALLVPVTFVMDPSTGIMMLLAVYVGSIYAGSITAILLRIPGTPASIPTMWDGHELTLQGKPRLALGTAALASGVGGVLSGLALMFLSPVLAGFALSFGPADYVAIVVFGLVVVVVLLGGSMTHAAAGAFVGLALSIVGFAPREGFERLTGGIQQLSGGLGIVPVLLGIFCLVEAFGMAAKSLRKHNTGDRTGLDNGPRLPSRHDLAHNTWNFLRSGAIGTGLGVMPAVGPETAPFVSYAAAKRASKDPDLYGKGSTEAIIAAETSNNANVGGSLIPLLTLGIPGSAVAAVFLGALTLQGLRPGPLLFVEQPTLMWALFIGFLLINVLMLFGGIFFVRQFAVVLRLPMGFLAAAVALFSILGAYSIGSTVFNIWVMFGAALLTFVLQKAKIPLPPVVLGLILGPILETNLTQALAISQGEWSTFIRHPIALVFLIITFVFLIYPIMKRFRRQRTDSVRGPEIDATHR